MPVTSLMCVRVSTFSSACAANGASTSSVAVEATALFSHAWFFICHPCFGIWDDSYRRPACLAPAPFGFRGFRLEILGFLVYYRLRTARHSRELHPAGSVEPTVCWASLAPALPCGYILRLDHRETPLFPGLPRRLPRALPLGLVRRSAPARDRVPRQG